MALQVLGWNTKALRLFERVGGECLREWWSVYLYKPNLHKLANQDMKEACTAEKVHFRPATKKDIPAILWLIQVNIISHGMASHPFVIYYRFLQNMRKNHMP